MGTHKDPFASVDLGATVARPVDGGNFSTLNMYLQRVIKNGRERGALVSIKEMRMPAPSAQNHHHHTIVHVRYAETGTEKQPKKIFSPTRNKKKHNTSALSEALKEEVGPR